MSACRQCGAVSEDTCRCWEASAAKYEHGRIQGEIRLDELRDELYGPGKETSGVITGRGTTGG